MIVILSDSRMIDRAWIYTALTRSEVNIEIVGQLAQFNSAVRRISSAEQRQTYIKTLLETQSVSPII